MKVHIIDELRPGIPDIDPGWEAETVRVILAGRGREVALAEERKSRRPTQFVLAAATVAVIIGGAFAAREMLPPSEVRPAGPVQRSPDPDDRFARTRAELKTMDQFATAETDRTYDAIGTKDFPLGEAPEDAYIFYKIGIECVDRTKYLFIVNGDRNAASARCDADDGFSATASESQERVSRGTENILTIEVNRDVRYTVTTGYHKVSIYKGSGPRGTLPDGRTYGSMGDKEAGPPDLVRVHGDAGVKGYVDLEELRGPMAANPAEAIAQQKAKQQRYRNGERVDRKVPVLDTEGRQVDVFSIMLPDPR